MWSWEFSGRHALQVLTHPYRLAIVRINKLISSLEDQSLVASLQGQGSVHISALSLSSLTICFFTFFFWPPAYSISYLTICTFTFGYHNFHFHIWPPVYLLLSLPTFTLIFGHFWHFHQMNTQLKLLPPGHLLFCHFSAKLWVKLCGECRLLLAEVVGAFAVGEKLKRPQIHMFKSSH